MCEPLALVTVTVPRNPNQLSVCKKACFIAEISSARAQCSHNLKGKSAQEALHQHRALQNLSHCHSPQVEGAPGSTRGPSLAGQAGTRLPGTAPARHTPPLCSPPSHSTLRRLPSTHTHTLSRHQQVRISKSLVPIPPSLQVFVRIARMQLGGDGPAWRTLVQVWPGYGGCCENTRQHRHYHPRQPRLKHLLHVPLLKSTYNV